MACSGLPKRPRARELSTKTSNLSVGPVDLKLSPDDRSAPSCFAAKCIPIPSERMANATEIR
jgi:hypothetical protein